MGGSLEVKSSRSAWPTWQNPISLKITEKKPKKQKTVARCGSACLFFPAAQEAGESLELGRQRLQ